MSKSISKQKINKILEEWNSERIPTFNQLNGRLPEKIIDSRKGIKYVFIGAEEFTNCTRNDERLVRYYDPLCKRSYTAIYEKRTLGFLERLANIFR